MWERNREGDPHILYFPRSCSSLNPHRELDNNRALVFINKCVEVRISVGQVLDKRHTNINIIHK